MPELDAKSLGVSGSKKFAAKRSINFSIASSDTRTVNSRSGSERHKSTICECLALLLPLDDTKHWV